MPETEKVIRVAVRSGCKSTVEITGTDDCPRGIEGDLRETFNALKSGAGAMKQLAKETDVDKVDKVMDEISDQTEKMRQVNEALGQQVGTPSWTTS